MPPTTQKILVTGAAGAVGTAVCRHLAQRGHFLRSLDMREAQHVAESHVGDIADGDAVRSAVAGMDAVIHLAATPDDAPFLEKLLQPNVVGLFNVMDAARHSGSVKRVVLASSVQTVNGIPKRERTVTASDVAPNNHYGLTKAWAEQMGEMYARCYGLAVLAIRIAWFTRNRRETDYMRQRGWFDSFLSHEDCGRFFVRCIEAELSPGSYHTLYATSKPTNRAWHDLEIPRRVIGYEPQDVFPQGLPFEA